MKDLLNLKQDLEVDGYDLKRLGDLYMFGYLEKRKK
jgi:hypothetical protein